MLKSASNRKIIIRIIAQNIIKTEITLKKITL